MKLKFIFKQLSLIVLFGMKNAKLKATLCDQFKKLITDINKSNIKSLMNMQE